VAISVDAPEVSRKLAGNAGYTFPILSDPQAETIRRYNLLHKGGGPEGSDIARPAEFLVGVERSKSAKPALTHLPNYPFNQFCWRTP
jgi:peroxiredoxin